MFDWEHGIALHVMQGNQVLSRGEGEVSWFFASCSENLEYILELLWGWPLKTRVCSVISELLYSYESNLWNLPEAWHGKIDASRGQVRDRGSLSSCHSDIGIPVNFQEESGTVTF